MDKDGELTDSSPCNICGEESAARQNGVPLCSRHLQTEGVLLPTVIEKVAEELSGTPSSRNQPFQ